MTMTGHNSGQLTEDEDKALFFTHVRTRIADNSRIKTASEIKKDNSKKFQLDGYTAEEIDFTVRAMTASDKGKITDRWLSFGRILGWLGLASGFQADLFKDRAPQIEKIRRDGENAGLAALERKSNFAPNSDEDLNWLEAYDGGQKIIRDQTQAAMEKKVAERKRVADEALQKAVKVKEPAPKPTKPKAGKDTNEPAVLSMKPKGKPPTPPKVKTGDGVTVQ